MYKNQKHPRRDTVHWVFNAMICYFQIIFLEDALQFSDEIGMVSKLKKDNDIPQTFLGPREAKN